MAKKRPKVIWLPSGLKARAKRLARLNNMTCSDLIRLSIEAKLPDYEAGCQPLKGIGMQYPVSRKPPEVIPDEIRADHEQPIS